MTLAMRTMINSGYRYAFSLCANTADAEDLVQEAWARLTDHGGVKDRAQLFITIKRIYIDRYRRSRIVQFVPLSPSHDAPDIEPPGDSGMSMSQSFDTRRAIEKAMRKLRHEERETLYLSLVEGYTAREISELLDRPRNTILSQIHRGKARMASHLSAFSPSPNPVCVTNTENE